MVERTAQKDPFSGRTEAPRFRGVSVTQRGINKSKFQPKPVTDTADIIQGLVSFAGAASSEVVKVLDKKVSEDKLVQTQRAILGQLPSKDATMGGYLAHAAVGAQNASMKAQAALNEAAKGTYTDEEWEGVIRETYQKTDEAMSEAYPDYATNTDAQKLMALALAEKMPQVTANREASKLDNEIKTRQATIGDIITTGIGNGEDVQVIHDRFVAQTKAMKLTQSQSDAILKDIIGNSDSNQAVELSKLYKGERSVSLYDRNEAIRTKEVNNKRASSSLKASEMAAERELDKTGFISGLMSEKDYLAKVQKRNEETGGLYASQAQIQADIRARNKATSERYAAAKLQERVGSGKPTYGVKPKDLKTALDSGWKEAINLRSKSIQGDASMSEEQKVVAMADAEKSENQRWGDISGPVNHTPIESWITDFKAFANTNIAANAITEDDGSQTLPVEFEKTLSLLNDISPSSYGFYMSKLDKREARVIRATMNMIDRGVPSVQAVQRAQSLVDNPNPVSAKVMREVEDKLTSDVDDGIFFTDMNDATKAHVRGEIRKDLALSGDPEGEREQTEIKARYRDGYTHIGDGTYVRGTASRLSQLTTIDTKGLGEGFKSMAWTQAEKILPNLRGGEYTLADLYPKVDDESGTVTFIDPDGIAVSTALPIGDMNKSYLKYKTMKEKRLRELRERPEDFFFDIQRDAIWD